MAEVIPFHGLRYDEAKAGPLSDLICPPYDVISDEDRERLYARNEHNAVRIEAGREDPGDDPVTNRYTRAKETLDRWTERGLMKVDPVPAFYLLDHFFELRGERQRRRGFLGALRLYQEGRGIVRAHERTFAKPKTDRLRLLRLTRTNTSPVFGMYEDSGRAIAEALDGWMSHGPARLVADARVGAERYLMWALDDRALTAKLAGMLKDKRIYLADGHHRYETALDFLQEEIEAKSVEFPEDAANFVLTYLCALDDPGLRILATHRLIRGADAALDQTVGRSFERWPIDRGALGDTQPGIALVRSGQLSEVRPRHEADLSALPEVWRTLPVAQAELLVDAATAAGGEVTYTHDTEAAIDAAKDGTSALLIRAVDPFTLQRVADARERLPQKTTYFYPKVPAGLVMRPLGL